MKSARKINLLLTLVAMCLALVAAAIAVLPDAHLGGAGVNRPGMQGSAVPPGK